MTLLLYRGGLCPHVSVSWRCVTLLLYPRGVLTFLCVLEPGGVCPHTSESTRCVTLLLYPRGVTLVDEEALAGGHVPLPDGGVRAAGDHEGVLGPQAVDVAEK